MSNQEFAGNAVIRYCIRCSHCCFDNIYKLGYIIITGLNIICCSWVSNESKDESVIETADTVETVGDSSIL